MHKATSALPHAPLPWVPPTCIARRNLLGVGLGLLPFAASAGYNFWTGEYTLTRQDLQAQVDKRFPLQLRYSELFEVRLDNPQLTLDASLNRVGLAADVHIRNPLIQPRRVQGALALSSGLKFDAATNAIRLDRPNADRVVLDGLDGQNAQQLQAIGAAVAQELLRDYALYTFKPEDLRRFGKTFEPGAITVLAEGIKVAPR